MFRKNSYFLKNKLKNARDRQDVSLFFRVWRHKRGHGFPSTIDNRRRMRLQRYLLIHHYEYYLRAKAGSDIGQTFLCCFVYPLRYNRKLVFDTAIA